MWNTPSGVVTTVIVRVGARTRSRVAAGLEDDAPPPVRPSQTFEGIVTATKPRAMMAIRLMF